MRGGEDGGRPQEPEKQKAMSEIRVGAAIYTVVTLSSKT